MFQPQHEPILTISFNWVKQKSHKIANWPQLSWYINWSREKRSCHISCQKRDVTTWDEMTSSVGLFCSMRLYRCGWQRRKASSQSGVSDEMSVWGCTCCLILNLMSITLHHHVPYLCILQLSCNKGLFLKVEANNDAALWRLLTRHVTRPFLVWYSIIETGRQRETKRDDFYKSLCWKNFQARDKKYLLSEREKKILNNNLSDVYFCHL